MILQQLRLLFFSFCSGIVVIGVVAAFIVPSDTADFSLPLAAGIVAALGLATLVAGGTLGRLDGSSNDALAESYRQRLILRLATAEAPALVGFLLSFLVGNLVPYLVALPFTAIAFARAAPTDGNLQKDQDALNATGATADLRTALG